jgi:phosphosulfolactate synthase
MVIDTGLPTHYFSDLVSSFSELVDVVKFGWGTALVTDDLKYKIDALRDVRVDYYFGGTLFEKFVSQGRFDDWRRFVDRFGCRHVEISNGTIELTNTEKARYVERVADDYTVFSEVGYKETARSETMTSQHWIDYIAEDLAAGAAKVITEARESGKSGICRSNGELRIDLIERIAASGIDIDRLLFEAPNKDLQVTLIRRFGPQVNLGNVAPIDIVALETLRLGLRGDTLLDRLDDHA